MANSPDVTRLNPTAGIVYRWFLAGACVLCGSMPIGNYCHCRWCDACASLWLAGSRAGGCEGQACRETCPECLAEPRIPGLVCVSLERAA